MPTVDVVVSCPVFDSFRVQQVAGLFDVAVKEKVEERLRVEVPELGEEWRVGLVVGPSGSGKTTIAKAMFGEEPRGEQAWPADRAVVDGLGELPVAEVVRLLTAVGFSSPPSWVKPYAALSNGERFRCDLARELARGQEVATRGGERPVVVFDEFTSVVDRNVARVGSAAVSRVVRSGETGCRFVAVTCHYDVEAWLEPDWTIDMVTRTFAWRRLRRPRVRLEVARCGREAWRGFARHHYLSGELNPLAECFVATWDDEPVAFCGTLNQVGRRGWRRISRLVTLPDYQGLGIGMKLAEAVGAIYREQGKRLSITASHPSVLGHCQRSAAWRGTGVRRAGGGDRRRYRGYRGGGGRTTASFEYVAVC